MATTQPRPPAEPLAGRSVSPWIDRAARPPRPRLEHDLDADVAIVGAGIVGLSAAAMLDRSGLDVVVLEARSVGDGTSGNSTAKVTSLHGLSYAELASTHGPETARVYAEANEFGVAAIARLAEELAIDCDLRRKPNHTYTEDAEEVPRIEAEVAAAQAAGLPASFTESCDLPFPIAAAVRLDEQLEFDPVAYLCGLAAALDAERPRVFERTRARRVSSDGVVLADGAAVRAKHVIVATQLPFPDRGLFFARTHASNSYAISARLRGPVPAAMYLSAESPPHSMRPLPWDGEELLIVGGAGHAIGRGDAVESFAALERYARERFAVDAIEHRWSAHDYLSDDGLPFVGALWPGSRRVLTATALRKWGYALGTASAAILTDAVLGRDNPWAASFDSWRRPPLSSLPATLAHTAEDGFHFFADRLRRPSSLDDLAPGAGRVIGSGLTQLAVHRDDAGALHAVSARCTHLGCIVRFNAAEQTWDCPCHGSRFEPGGGVLNGPATAPLEPREPPISG